MAAFSTPHSFTAFTFLVLFFKIVTSDPISSFSFPDFDKDLKFESNVALLGGSKVVNGGSAVQLSGSESRGGVMYKKPIKLIGGKPKQLISFSTDFAFSILSVDGDGLAFVMVPSGLQDDFFKKSPSGISSSQLSKRKSMVVDVKFTAEFGSRNGGSAHCNVAINVGDSAPAKTRNTSSLKMALRKGQKLHTWIDYEASSQRLEVRLSQYGHSRPADPLIWYSIDFTKIWKKSEMFVGFNSVKGNRSFQSQPCSLHSWSFNQRPFPNWMHSEPVDLKALSKNSETAKVKPRSDCVLRVLAAMIFGGGCGALTAFVVLYLWTIFGNRRPVVPEEFVGEQPVDFEYKKVSVVVDKAIKDGKE
ncbi:L-type lectin-domain containing receptor kinase S.4-like [Neltuma alba]|uniref:L-type lectin-domain containing receptor kinase S.4 n=1 Tax=Neltuma alba TaxID=207710 RepID=UPI0010A3509C|nr:L-type lectin-domain containing receptor kinase S.4-like [Prosopis alba]XP_028785210.1 L-type lectin-domain containing receptor kinase S.4-like [Prosopis alba]